MTDLDDLFTCGQCGLTVGEHTAEQRAICEDQDAHEADLFNRKIGECARTGQWLETPAIGEWVRRRKHLRVVP